LEHVGPRNKENVSGSSRSSDGMPDAEGTFSLKLIFVCSVSAPLLSSLSTSLITAQKIRSTMYLLSKKRKFSASKANQSTNMSFDNIKPISYYTTCDDTWYLYPTTSKKQNQIPQPKQQSKNATTIPCPQVWDSFECREMNGRENNFVEFECRSLARKKGFRKKSLVFQ
jgi:hypothetical protein